MAILAEFVFQEPPFLVIMGMPPIIFLLLGCLGLAEATGKHLLQYSKFCMVGSDQSQYSLYKQIKLSSKTGMLFLYTPALLAGVVSLLLFPHHAHNTRLLFVKLALSLHFFKRVMEVLFVHKYSGGMIVDTVILISFIYFFYTSSMIYIQHLVQVYPEPLIDLKNVGLLLFLVGIVGNLYHHYLLSKTRKKGEKTYKIPKGGLFSLVICPHYLFEITELLGLAFISQTMLSFSFAFGSAFYLTGRSCATRKWYLSKFENFPKHVKALIPYVL